MLKCPNCERFYIPTTITSNVMFECLLKRNYICPVCKVKFVITCSDDKFDVIKEDVQNENKS